MKYSYWNSFCDTFNGCQKVGKPCDNCWAIPNVWRLAHNPNEKLKARYGGLVQNHRTLRRPVECKDEIFCCSMDGVKDWSGRTTVDFSPLEQLSHVHKPQVVAFSWRGDWMLHDTQNIRRALVLMTHTNHVYLTLTKRPEALKNKLQGCLMPQCWIGVSAWDQASYNNACHHLAPLKAAGWHTWVSLEPMLGPVDITCAVNTHTWSVVDWIVVGAETGKGAREIKTENILRVCYASTNLGIPCFVKHTNDDTSGKLIKYYQQLPREIAVKGITK